MNINQKLICSGVVIVALGVMGIAVYPNIHLTDNHVVAAAATTQSVAPLPVVSSQKQTRLDVINTKIRSNTNVNHATEQLSAVSEIQQMERQQIWNSLQERLHADVIEVRVIEVPSKLDDNLVIAIGNGAYKGHVQLEKHSVRSENFKVLVQGDNNEITEIPAGPERTYVGHFQEDSSVRVWATLLDSGGLSATVVSAKDTWSIAPLTEEEAAILGTDLGGAGTAHAVYRSRPFEGTPEDEILFKAPPMYDAEGNEIAALGSTGEIAPTAARAAPALVQIQAIGETVSVAQVEMGFDVAYSFYSGRCSSNTSTCRTTIQNWVNTTLNPPFVTAGLIEHKVGVIMIRTSSASDPYRGMTDSNAVLAKFRDTWNGSGRPSTTHQVAQLALNQNIGNTGLAYVGTIGTSNKYGITTAVSGMGYWANGARHEVGHSWSLSHGDGCGVEATPTGDYQFGLMCTGAHDRMNSVESQKVRNHRHTRGSGVLNYIGSYPASKKIAPYGVANSYSATRGRASFILDVLANDWDANNDNFRIDAIDANPAAGDQRVYQATPTSVTTRRGGKVIRSVGTGAGGRDQLRYTPPAAGGLTGMDDFVYFIRDGGGSGGWGYVKVTVN
jgi:Metallo-peptidase family M12